MKNPNKPERTPSNFVRHVECPKCGSSDANAVYDNNTTHCWSCKANGTVDGYIGEVAMAETTDFNPRNIEYKYLSKRNIKESIAKQYSYGFSNGDHVCNYYDNNGVVVAQKFRNKDKNFAWTGNAKQATLFGQNLFKPDKKKRIVITEGELDALSIAQIFEGKWPVISIANGAASAKRDLQKHLEYLLGFKEVVIAFDNDKPGQEAAVEVAKLFPPNFCKLAKFSLKDANEMLVAGLEKEMAQALWEAKPYKPEGILAGADILTRLENEQDVKSYPFPAYMEGTNQKTKGIRLGELDIFTSGTGSGKTTLLKQLQFHFYKTTDFNQALIHLEEPLEHTAKDLVGISMDTRLNLQEGLAKEFYMTRAREIFNAKDAEGLSRFCLYDSFGSMEPEDLFNKIRFMVKGLGCRIIWLDHLSILVSGMDNTGDERRTIDYLMHELKSLTIELNCYIGLVVHLNNSTVKPFENGAIPTLNNLRGSGGIKQLSNQVYAFSRDQQAESEEERNTSSFTVLKSRYTGSTGIADYLFFNSMTGKLEAGRKPEKGMPIRGESSDFD